MYPTVEQTRARVKASRAIVDKITLLKTVSQLRKTVIAELRRACQSEMEIDMHVEPEVSGSILYDATEIIVRELQDHGYIAGVHTIWEDSGMLVYLKVLCPEESRAVS